MARRLARCWPALILLMVLAIGCSNSAATPTTEPTTSSSVATTQAPSTTSPTSTTSTATTLPPTTTSTTWERPHCPWNWFSVDPMPPASALAWPPAWAEYDGALLARRAAQMIDYVETGLVEPVGKDTEPNPYQTIGGFVDLGPFEPLTILKGNPPANLAMAYDDVVLLASAADATNPVIVLLGFEPPNVNSVLPESVAAIALILPDFRVLFTQVCSDYLQEELDKFAAHQTLLPNATPADLLRGLAVEDPETLAAHRDWWLHAHAG